MTLCQTRVGSLAFSRKQSGELRICLDPKNLNQAVKRTHQKVPTLEEMNHLFADSKVFSNLDAKHGYWGIVLSDESSVWNPDTIKEVCPEPPSYLGQTPNGGIQLRNRRFLKEISQKPCEKLTFRGNMSDIADPDVTGSQVDKRSTDGWRICEKI